MHINRKLFVVVLVADDGSEAIVGADEVELSAEAEAARLRKLPLEGIDVIIVPGVFKSEKE